MQTTVLGGYFSNLKAKRPEVAAWAEEHPEFRVHPKWQDTFEEIKKWTEFSGHFPRQRVSGEAKMGAALNQFKLRHPIVREWAEQNPQFNVPRRPRLVKHRRKMG